MSTKRDSGNVSSARKTKSKRSSKSSAPICQGHFEKTSTLILPSSSDVGSFQRQAAGELVWILSRLQLLGGPPLGRPFSFTIGVTLQYDPSSDTELSSSNG